jgi:hypothetical protein
MELRLEPGEVALLRTTLERAAADLREEIGKTENYDMRQDLKRDEETLRAIVARLG